MDLSSFEDNSRNLTIKSVIPEITLSEPCCVGIDEAGRGPVLGKKAISVVFLDENQARPELGNVLEFVGPMVYGICYFPLSKSEEVKNLGVAG